MKHFTQLVIIPSLSETAQVEYDNMIAEGHEPSIIRAAMCDGEALEEIGIDKDTAEEIYNYLRG